MRDWQVGDPIGDSNDIGVPDTKYMSYNKSRSNRSYEPHSFTNLPPRNEIYSSAYKTYINLARTERYDEFIVYYYKKAVNDGLKYWDIVEEENLAGGAIPDKNNLLSPEDISKCVKLHKKYQSKLSTRILNTNQETIEDIFKKTGNENALPDYVSRMKEIEKSKESREKRKKEIDESIKKAKEECEKNPDCLKEKIHKIDRQLSNNGITYSFFGANHFNYFQRKINEALGEKLRLLSLLEDLNIEEDTSENHIKKYKKSLKKENRKLKFFISHLDEEHAENAKILLEKNNKKLNELEKKSSKKRVKIKLF